jgi:hypothetical protein
MLESFGECKYFLTIDLASRYWQVPMAIEDRKKTAFITRQGLFEFTVMLFSLTNTPAIFQQLMNKILEETNDHFTAVYMNDIIVYLQTFKEHFMHLGKVFQLLEKVKLKCGTDKCSFCKTMIPFLSHIITLEGIKLNEILITKIKNFPLPQNITTIQSFLGLSGYYRQFIKDYAKIALPLT